MAKVAFVTGVNGITGSAIVEHLVKHTTSDQWSKIIITSRSPLALSVSDRRIEFIALDFLRDPKDVAEQMRETCQQVTHAYFSSYVHKDDFDELNTANASIFENFLNALTMACPHLENVTLQTGGKYYGMHLFLVPTPAQESDPRPSAPIGNFYYPQEDFLQSKQEKSQNKWNWNVIRPMGIIGTSPKPNGMNVALTLAMYILTCKKLNPQHPPFLPTNQLYWTGTEVVSDARVVAEMTIWASTTPTCANQAFNASNGDHFTWRYMWPRLLEYFGIPSSPPPSSSSSPSKLTPSLNNFLKPPPKEGDLQQEFTMHDWSTTNDTKSAYESLCDETGVPEAKASWEGGSWMVMDWIMQRTWTATVTNNKALKYGFTGHVDTFDSFVENFERMREEKQIPSW